MKLFRCLPLLFTLVSSADEPVLFVPLERNAPLAQLAALAKRPEQNSARTGFDEVRCEALRLLAEQPKGAPRRGRRSRTRCSRPCPPNSLRSGMPGAAGLAKRGYRSEIGRFFSRLEADPQAFIHFYRALESPQKNLPPVGLFRKGLHSSSTDARAAMAEAVREGDENDLQQLSFE